MKVKRKAEPSKSENEPIIDEFLETHDRIIQMSSENDLKER